MEQKLSERLSKIINSLPLSEGLRVLEIGCGSGALARAVVKCVGNGHVLAIDRSEKAIQQAINLSEKEIASDKLTFIQTSIETFKLEVNTKPYDLAIAILVGALDGRHPEIEQHALQNIAKALKKKVDY